MLPRSLEYNPRQLDAQFQSQRYVVGLQELVTNPPSHCPYLRYCSKTSGENSSAQPIFDVQSHDIFKEPLIQFVKCLRAASPQYDGFMVYYVFINKGEGKNLYNERL